MAGALIVGGFVEDCAQPYAGVAESLEAVHRAGLRTAVVTNKQHRFAAALLEIQRLPSPGRC